MIEDLIKTKVAALAFVDDKEARLLEFCGRMSDKTLTSKVTNIKLVAAIVTKVLWTLHH